MSGDGSSRLTLAQAEGVAIRILEALSEGATGDEEYRRFIEGPRAALTLAERGTYPTCWNASVAGSVRHGRESCGDVELVLGPKTVTKVRRTSLFKEKVKVSAIEDPLEDLIHSGLARRGDRWGERARKLVWMEPEIGVDIYIVHNARQWGNILTVRTGPRGFSKAYVTALRRVGYKSEGGWIRPNNKKTSKLWRDKESFMDPKDPKSPVIVPATHERDCFTHTGLKWVPLDERTPLPGESMAGAFRRWGWG